MQRRLRKFDNLIKYLVAAILLVVPLYPKFPFIRVPGTFVSIRLEDFIIVLAALVIAVIVLPDINRFLKNNIYRAIVLFLLVGATSLASAVLVTKTVAPHIGILHWVRRVEYFVPFFIGFYAIKNRKGNLEFYLKVLMISLILAFVYGLGQRYFSWPIIVTQNQEYARGVALRYTPGSHINSTFAGHYDLGTFLAFLLPVYISLFFLLKKPRTRLAILVVISAGLWLLAHSGSRISIVSYLAAAIGSLFLVKKYRAIPLVVIFSILIFSTSPNLMARYSRIIGVTYEKIKGINRILYLPSQGMVYAQDEEVVFPQRRKKATPTPTPIPIFEDRSTSIRLNVEWPRAVRALSKNPLLGTGFSSITLATDNDYLRLLGEVGILGFLAFSLIFIRIGKLILKVLPFDKYYKSTELGFFSGIVGGLFGVFVNAIFIDVFEASKFAMIFWLFMGMAVSLARIKQNE